MNLKQFINEKISIFSLAGKILSKIICYKLCEIYKKKNITFLRPKNLQKVFQFSGQCDILVAAGKRKNSF